MGLFSRRKNQNKLICYACESPIIGDISRKRVFKDSNGNTFELHYHYFPPCSKSNKIPKNCECIAYALNVPTKQLLELMKIDDAIKIDQKIIETLINKGTECHELGKYEEAIEYFDQALKIGPYYATAWANKGASLYEVGKHKEAIDCLDRALKIDLSSKTAWFNKGTILEELGRYEESKACFAKVKELE